MHACAFLSSCAAFLALPLAAAVVTGESGEWRVVYDDGASVCSADWKAHEGEGWTYRETKEPSVMRCFWTSPEVDVTVTTDIRPGGIADRRIALFNRGGRPIATCDFPAKLRFAPDSVKRFVYPGRGNYGLGMAFNAKFFRPTTRSVRS